MAITDRCVHGAPLGACVYCAMGSKGIDDIAKRLDIMDLAREIQEGQNNRIAIDAAIKQRNILVEATNEIGFFLEEQTPIKMMEDLEVRQVLEYVVQRLRRALIDISKLQPRVDNPRAK